MTVMVIFASGEELKKSSVVSQLQQIWQATEKKENLVWLAMDSAPI